MVQIHQERWGWKVSFQALNMIPNSPCIFGFGLHGCVPSSPLMVGCKTLVDRNLLCSSLYPHGNLHTTDTRLT